MVMRPLLSWTVVAAAATAAADKQGNRDFKPRADQQQSTNLPWSPPHYPSPWMDGSGGWDTAYARAKAFVSQLTLLEKVNLTTGVGWEGEACVGNVGSIPRLGFRALCLQDSPLGVRMADYNSAFPAGGTVAASWDRQIWYDRGFAMGREHAGKGVDIQLGPVVGPLGRAPQAGRGWEGFSPDPFLSGVAVAQTVKGIQKAGVIACTKHYLGNEQERFRQAPEARDYGFNISESMSSNIDDVTLHELYLWPFADAVRAGTGAIMCSYQQLNNSYSCQNSYLLNYILKGELGFQGVVLSDWSAQQSGVASTLAGLDMTMPGDVTFDSSNSYWGPNLTISILNGTVPQWRLDDMATRVMAAYYYVGRDSNAVDVNFNSWSRDIFGFQHAYAKTGYSQINFQVDVREEHAQLIRQHAAASTVLLKNVNGTLPLKPTTKLTAVFGNDAGDSLLGPNGCSDRGCDNGTLAMGWGSGTANFPYLISPLTALQNYVLGTKGTLEWVTDNWAMDQIWQLAARSQTSLVFVDADSGEGYISIDGNQGDRNNLTLWRNGDAMIETVAGICSNTIVVIHSTGPVLVESWANHPNVTAIIWAGLPGEQSGNALTDVLYGHVNPGGKLPFTIGKNEDDWGTKVLSQPNNGHGAPQDNFSEGIFIDYRYFDKKNIAPSYEFGFGLSYTTFQYSNIKLQAYRVPPYAPNSGYGLPAVTLGTYDTDSSTYQFPANFTSVEAYIYPYLNSTDLKEASQDPAYGSRVVLPAHATDGAAQRKVRAGGAPGGNPRLYDVLFTVTATVTNTGSVAGDEVAQLYINLGGSSSNAPKVLRGFERLKDIPAGGTATFSVDVCRRDVMNWSPEIQDWYVGKGQKIVYVGGSSRKLALSVTLPPLTY